MEVKLIELNGKSVDWDMLTRQWDIFLLCNDAQYN